MLIFIGAGTLFMILIDILKRYIPFVSRLYRGIFGKILREDESDFSSTLFTGGTWYALGIFLALLLFSRETAVASILIMIWSDSFAAIIGRNFGKHKIGNKTLEGSFAFIFIGMVIILIVPGLTVTKPALICASSAVILTAVFELLPLRVNDNLTLPLFFGFTFNFLLKLTI
jgi:dolichol kinase